MSGPPSVTVFTITYNQRSKVLALAEDLAAQDYPPEQFELVVLDDGGTDGTTRALADVRSDLPYRLKLLTRPHEAHYLNAKRWNECVAAASAMHDIFIQVDDVRVRPDFITRHVDWHTEPDRLTVVAGAKFEGEHETWDLASCRRALLAGPDGSAGEDVPWTAAWGVSLSYQRTLLNAIWQEPFERPFDERMTGWGFHEVDFACRAVQAGARVVYDPAVGVFHQNHSPVHDRGRGIDHADEKARGEQQNEKYLLAKHDLAALPRW